MHFGIYAMAQWDLVTMPSSLLNHQVCKWFGIQNGKNWIGLYKENTFYENQISLT